MQINLNGHFYACDEGCTLEALVQQQKLSLDGLAVAIDEKIIPKSQFSSFVLKEGMKVDIFTLVAGG